MSELINNFFNDKVTEESAKALFDLIYSEGKKIGKRVYDKIKVQTALKNYADSYLKRYGIIKVLGMAEPLPLKEIYTEVKIVSINYLNKEKDINHLERNFKIERMFRTGNKENGIDIANNVSTLNILGSPGSGKSTFLKKIGLEALLRKSTTNNNQASYSHNCIPVFIELKRFKNEEINVKSLIQNEFENAGFPESEYFLEKALEHGKLLILLDGLDEVPSQILNESIQHIKDFTNKFAKNRFITSCRTAFYKSYLTGFTDVEIASFDNTQIKSFINNWFNLEKDISAGSMNRLTELLFNDSNNSTLELARTPLLLTFICLTFDASLRFPANRSSLYRKALMILMERWAAEKRIHNEDIYQDLNSDLELEMLAEVAAKFFEQDKTFFYRQELKNEILLFLNNLTECKKYCIQ